MDDKSSALPKETDLRSYALSGQVMLVTVVALLSVLLLTLSLHFYFRFHSRRRNNNNAAASTPRPHHHHSLFLRRGLHPSFLKSLPTFSYSSAAHPYPLDCAVCLSEFEHAQTGRVLPACRHCFHVDCIDAWFRSHSNCPLCRAPVKPTRQPGSGESVIAVGERVGSAVFVPVECRRKSVDWVAEPPRWVGSGTGEGGSES